jgi:poly(A) polymerase Pap1
LFTFLCNVCDPSGDSEEVLGHVSDLVRKFVEETCLKHNLSPEAAKKAGGKIYTYGSYRLGVHGPGTDIDTLIVGPKHVDRQDFNEIFLRMLEQDPIVSEVSVGLLCFGLCLKFTWLCVSPSQMRMSPSSRRR